jgi:hypothetical protein
MGYRDDFYVYDNILGITGQLYRLPTVYFKSAAGEYGHITQVHGDDFNWGRTEVVRDEGWQITNDCPQGKCEMCEGETLAHEVNGNGWVFHVSRNEFVPKDELIGGGVDVAAQAIYRCPYKKTDPFTHDRYVEFFKAPGLADQLRDTQNAAHKADWDARNKYRGGMPRHARWAAVDYTGERLVNRLVTEFRKG